MSRKKKLRVALSAINVVLAAIEVYMQWKIVKEQKQV